MTDGQTGPSHLVRIRPVAPHDDHAIRSLFRATVCLGSPLPFDIPGIGRYEALCLDWYLGPGRTDAAVAEEDGRIVGFALVCTDQRSYRASSRRQAVRFGMWAAAMVCLRRLPTMPAQFYRLRLRDGWQLWRSSLAEPMPSHAHINLDSAHRAGDTGRRLAAHVDSRCRQAGLPGWFGEINAVAGRRAGALERLGGRVVDRAPNHTLTWLAGRPVERLTVVRDLPDPDPDGEGEWW